MFFRSRMITVFSIAFLSALAITGVITVLFIALSSIHTQFEVKHWIAALFCVILSSLSLAAAIGAGKASKLVGQTADVVTGYTDEAMDILESYLPEELLEDGGRLKTLTESQVEIARQNIDAKFHKAIILSVIVTVVLNALYLLLLVGTCRKVSRRHSGSDDLDDGLDSDYGSFSGSLDDIDNEL